MDNDRQTAAMPGSAGGRPQWEVADLPEPPQFAPRSVLRVIGPGAITLSMSIGLGEWVLGPMVVTNHGLSLLWVVTVAVVLQLALNLEFVRYTMYTGEPVVNGFLRLPPHPVFWGVLFVLFTLMQGGWPAWAAASAAPLFAGLAGHLPGAGDEAVMLTLGVGNFLICAFIVAVGGKIERTLEIVNWVMVIFIFGFLFIVCLVYVPFSVWTGGILGFFGLTNDFHFLLIPEGVDWALLGGFAGFAAAGGIANLTISNYYRDKGIGMGRLVGYIPAAFGGKQVPVYPIGKVFPATADNLQRWRDWWRYVKCDQIGIWAIGCFLGMYLNCILAAHIIPRGTELNGLAIGAFQAQYLGLQGGELLRLVTLVNGFWILFGSQLVTIDAMARLNTDILWSMSDHVRNWAKDDIRRVYYTLLTVMVVWGCVALNLAQPKILLLISSNAAGFILVVSAITILVLNHMVLPAPIRARPWQRLLVAAVAAFYGAFFLRNLIGLVAS